MLGNLLLLAATLAVLHAAFSVYEHLSSLKARGPPEHPLPADLVAEALAALGLAIAGAALRAPPLREVSWRSEMKHRAAAEDTARMSFAAFVQRAAILAAPAEGLTE